MMAKKVCVLFEFYRIIKSTVVNFMGCFFDSQALIKKEIQNLKRVPQLKSRIFKERRGAYLRKYGMWVSSFAKLSPIKNTYYSAGSMFLKKSSI